MHANLRQAERGQAVVETVIFLPMFLLTLFGIIWTVQAAVQYERVESAVRYAGLISQRVDPYVDYSFYSMYTQLGSATMPTLPCITPLTTPLSDAAPTYTSSQTVTASTPFWTPTSATPSCASSGLTGAPAGTGFAQDVILSQQQPGMSATIGVPAALHSTLGALSTVQADLHFFKPVGENVIIACYPKLNTLVTSALKYQTDISLALVPVALPVVVIPTTLSANSSCTSP